MIQKDLVRKLAQERIDERFPEVFIVDISISAKNSINVDLDKEGSYVSIEECMAVSRNIEHNLDREVEDFELQVSSAGLDKPFRVLKQYIKNIDKEVDVVMKDGVKLSGILKAADDKNITLETTRVEKLEGMKKKETIVEQLVLALAKIKETKIVISFK
ncbi:MAG: ribosome assembly cofactor RimP [Flavobacteriia bacterium]|jgi:ribosome maturation factor RimP